MPSRPLRRGPPRLPARHQTGWATVAPQLEVGMLAAQLCAPVPGGTGRYTSRAHHRTRAGATGRRRARGRPWLGAVRRRCRVTGPRALPRPAVSHPGAPVGAGPSPRVRGTVVHAPTLLVPSRPRRGALVVTIHDAVPWTHPETLTPRGVSFHRTMAARAAEDADVITTPTEAVARQLREILSPRGVFSASLPARRACRCPRTLTRSAGAPESSAHTSCSSGPPSHARDSTSSSPRCPDLGCTGTSSSSWVRKGWGSVSVDGLARAAGVSTGSSSPGRSATPCSRRCSPAPRPWPSRAVPKGSVFPCSRRWSSACLSSRAPTQRSSRSVVGPPWWPTASTRTLLRPPSRRRRPVRRPEGDWGRLVANARRRSRGAAPPSSCGACTRTSPRGRRRPGGNALAIRSAR